MHYVQGDNKFILLARIDEALTLVDNAIGNAKGSLSHN